MDIVPLRIRLLIGGFLAVLLVLDIFASYSTVRASVKTSPNGLPETPAASEQHSVADINTPTSTGLDPVEVLNKFQMENAKFSRTEDESNDINDVHFKLQTAKIKIEETIKESCLPKLLCEMASKPQYMLTEKERELLQMIRSSSMSLLSYGLPKYWHFATHMGELLRHTNDGLSGPMGCANLWPKCPISSKKLSRISNAMQL